VLAFGLHLHHPTYHTRVQAAVWRAFLCIESSFLPALCSEPARKREQKSRADNCSIRSVRPSSFCSPVELYDTLSQSVLYYTNARTRTNGRTESLIAAPFFFCAFPSSSERIDKAFSGYCRASVGDLFLPLVLSLCFRSWFSGSVIILFFSTVTISLWLVFSPTFL
jgi:hypothetical protein